MKTIQMLNISSIGGICFAYVYTFFQKEKKSERALIKCFTVILLTFLHEWGEVLEEYYSTEMFKVWCWDKGKEFCCRKEAGEAGILTTAHFILKCCWSVAPTLMGNGAFFSVDWTDSSPVKSFPAHWLLTKLVSTNVLSIFRLAAQLKVFSEMDSFTHSSSGNLETSISLEPVISPQIIFALLRIPSCQTDCNLLHIHKWDTFWKSTV